MYKTEKFDCYSISELLDKYAQNIIQKRLDDFRCSKNDEVQKYLLNNSIEFTKKHQAITYLVYDKKDNLSAYFTLAIKPISINIDSLSNTSLNLILRISEVDNISKTVNPAAYLIAQIGKADDSDINIDDIFEMVDYYINEFQNGCGGVVEFLESENNEKLINIYRKKGFNTFNIRKSKSGEERKLIQMYRLI